MKKIVLMAMGCMLFANGLYCATPEQALALKEKDLEIRQQRRTEKAQLKQEKRDQRNRDKARKEQLRLQEERATL